MVRCMSVLDFIRKHSVFALVSAAWRLSSDRGFELPHVGLPHTCPFVVTVTIVSLDITPETMT